MSRRTPAIPTGPWTIAHMPPPPDAIDPWHAEKAWAPILGPASLAAWRRLHHIDAGTIVDVADMAKALGLNRHAAENALVRLTHFKIAEPSLDGVLRLAHIGTRPLRPKAIAEVFA